jgi:hypothetical protein
MNERMITEVCARAALRTYATSQELEHKLIREFAEELLRLKAENREMSEAIRKHKSCTEIRAETMPDQSITFADKELWLTLPKASE